MTTEIIPFPPNPAGSGSGHGGGSGMIELRVSALEKLALEAEQRLTAMDTGVSRVQDGLTQLKPLLQQIIQDGQALRQDIGKDAASMRAELANVRLETEKLRGEVREMAGRQAQLPSTWTILGIVFTTWALGSGLLLSVMKSLK